MTPIPPLLQRHLDDSLAHAGLWLQRVVQDARQALLASDSPGLRAASRSAAGEVLTALQQRYPLLVRHTLDELQAQVRSSLASGNAPMAQRLSLDDLQLVDDTQAAQDIEVLRVVQLTGHAAEWELRELQARIATLRGERDIRASANPLRPEIVARAFWAASAELRLEPEARLLLMRAAGEPLAHALREAYAEAVKRLDAQGVQPAAYRAVQLPGTAGRGAAAAPPNSGFDVTRPGALDELLPTPGTRARRAAASPGVTLAPEAQARLDAALERVLAQLPQGDHPAQGSAATGGAPGNVIRAHQAALEGAARNDSDQHVIALLAQLFDRILADATLLPAVRRRLARLQKGVLCIALHDPRLLNDYSQPSWRLMNRLASHTLGYDDPADPRLAPFLAELDPLLDALTRQRVPEATQHAEALVQLEALMLKHLRTEQRAAGSAIEKLRLAERREELQERYHQELEAQLAGMGAVLSAPLRRFLLDAWPQVLATSTLRDGDAAPATLQYASAVDELLLSLQPLRSPQDRARLLGMLQPLVQRLQQGMALIGLPDAQREAVLTELMQRHTELLKSDGRAAPGADRELTPEEIVQRLREETLESAARHTGGGDHLMDVSALDTVPAELLPELDAAVPKPAVWLDRVATGTWCHLAMQGGWTPMRLLWVSEARNHWLFSSAPGRTHSYTRRALDRLTREHLAMPLEERNLLERAVDALLADGAKAATAA